MSARAPRLVIALGTALVAACSLVRHPTPPPPPTASLAEQEWPEARRAALNFEILRQFDRSDSVLRAFAARYPGTPLSAETLYLRAIIRLDPVAEGNVPSELTRDARSKLDAYIAGGPTLPHYGEAVLLRRLTGHLDSLHATSEAVRNLAMSTPTAASTAGVRDTLRMRDEELQRVRAELEQTRAELDRIRRRVAPPKP